MTSPAGSVDHLGLVADLYQLTMAQSYSRGGMNARATFDLLLRDLPESHAFIIACGIHRALDILENLRFGREEIRYLGALALFDEAFLDLLGRFRFSGDVWAVAEGVPLLPHEFLMRVEAPLIEAQIVETVLLNAVHYPTLAATKAARCVEAAPGAVLMEFGLRRAPGVEAGLEAARAAYLAGFAGTSNLLAGRRLGIPVYGTMAHSYVLAHRSEREAFLRYARDFPNNAILLIDTYDTTAGARAAAEVARIVAAEGIRVSGVRLDSGDIPALSREVRRILDRAGFPEIRIFASGDMDEYRLEEFGRREAPIDGYGVGTRLVTSADLPYFESAYKLVEYDGRPVRKLSLGKGNLPGRKQIFRIDEGAVRDEIRLADEPGDGRPLLTPVMRAGRRIAREPSLQASREACLAATRRLPAELRQLRRPARAPVTLSAGVASLLDPGG